MNLTRLLTAILLVIGLGFGTPQSSHADYMLSPVAERFMVMPDSWTLQKSSPGGDFDKLHVTHKGKTYEWPIDLFLLADRTDSNTICTGSYKQFTKGYLESLSASKSNAPVRVEVITNKTGEPLRVAGVWSVDFKESWNRAIQQGSRVLNMSAEQVRAFKTPEMYEKRIRQQSEDQWNLVDKR
jgi:hypothetical protein